MVLVIKNLPASTRGTRDTRGVRQALQSMSSQSPARLSTAQKHEIYMRLPLTSLLSG